MDVQACWYFLFASQLPCLNCQYTRKWETYDTFSYHIMKNFVTCTSEMAKQEITSILEV
jgi:hypothetical protein